MSEILPDCRAVIDSGLIDESALGARTELISPAFENISVIEPLYAPGEIAVTDPVATRTDRALVTSYADKRRP